MRELESDIVPKWFACLGHPARLVILRELSMADASDGLGVLEIARRLEMSRWAASHHIKVLAEGGLVDQRLVGNRKVTRIALAPVWSMWESLDALLPR